MLTYLLSAFVLACIAGLCLGRASAAHRTSDEDRLDWRENQG